MSDLDDYVSFSVGRLVLTQAVGFHDSNGETDAQDITWQYKKKEGTQEERLAVYNAVRGVDKAMKFYEVPSKEQEDVVMDLIELERVQYGQPYKARVILEVRVRIISFCPAKLDLYLYAIEPIESTKNIKSSVELQLHLLHWNNC